MAQKSKKNRWNNPSMGNLVFVDAPQELGHLKLWHQDRLNTLVDRRHQAVHRPVHVIERNWADHRLNARRGRFNRLEHVQLRDEVPVCGLKIRILSPMNRQQMISGVDGRSEGRNLPQRLSAFRSYRKSSIEVWFHSKVDRQMVPPWTEGPVSRGPRS